MYCRSCGSELRDGDIFCSKCGAQQNVENLTKNEDDSKEAIVKKLKPYKRLKKCSCLECGYEGLMGVVGLHNPMATYILRIVFYVISFAILFSILGARLITFLIFGFSIAIIDLIIGKKRLFCPSCEREIIEK